MAENKDYTSTEAMLADMNKKFGSGSISRLGDSNKVQTEFRSSGSLRLDWALGGGYGKGRLVSLEGREAGGKTALANLAIAEAQLVEPEKENAILDLEYAYRTDWAETIGVDTKKLIISQPDTWAEKVWEMVELMVISGRFAFIVMDSLDSLVMKAEWENTDWEKNTRVGGSSGLNTIAMRKLVNTGILTKSGTTLIVVKQLRDDIGGFSMFGTPTRTSGGRSVKHNSTQCLEVTKGEQFIKGSGASKEVLGQQIKIKVAKNKLGQPYNTAALDLYFETGIDKIMEIIETAKLVGVLKGTSWLTFMNPTTGEIFLDSTGADMKFNGVNKAAEAMRADVEAGGDLYNHMYQVVNEVLRGG